MVDRKLLAISMLCICMFMGCTSAPSASSAPAPGRLQVVTSFRPFTLLVGPVAGDDAEITQILPPGADPHDYEPTPRDAVTLQNASIFFFDGPFLEPWASSIAASANPDIKLVSFADSIPAQAFAQMESQYPNFPNVSQDPHLWLSPKLAEYFVPYVAQQLSAADPAHAADYNSNAQAYVIRLQKLDADYTAGLANCTTRTFLSSHAFLDYVAADYNLTAISIAGLSPDAEPSIEQMDSIINESKTDHVMGVLAEPDEAQQLSQSVAGELGLPVYPFSTMEILPAANQNASANDYISIQEENLQELRSALGCR